MIPYLLAAFPSNRLSEPVPTERNAAAVLTLPALSFTGAGEFTEFPTGTSDITLPAFSLAGNAGYQSVSTGNLDVTLPAFALAAQAFTETPVFSGQSNVDLPAISLSASAEFQQPVFTGTQADLTLPVISFFAAGATSVSIATANLTFPSFILTATGTTADAIDYQPDSRWVISGGVPESWVILTQG